MTTDRYVNLMLPASGATPVLASPGADKGYDGPNPVVRIVGIPPDISADNVIQAYQRCMFVPTMHAEIEIPWHRIAGAEMGQVVRLTAGRPAKPTEEKSVRINITLSPGALAILDRSGIGRSQEIERLIQESATPQVAHYTDDDERSER